MTHVDATSVCLANPSTYRHLERARLVSLEHGSVLLHWHRATGETRFHYQYFDAFCAGVAVRPDGAGAYLHHTYAVDVDRSKVRRAATVRSDAQTLVAKELLRFCRPD